AVGVSIESHKDMREPCSATDQGHDQRVGIEQRVVLLAGEVAEWPQPLLVIGSIWYISAQFKSYRCCLVKCNPGSWMLTGNALRQGNPYRVIHLDRFIGRDGSARSSRQGIITYK